MDNLIAVHREIVIWQCRKKQIDSSVAKESLGNLAKLINFLSGMGILKEIKRCSTGSIETIEDCTQYAEEYEKLLKEEDPHVISSLETEDVKFVCDKINDYICKTQSSFALKKLN